MNGAWQAVGVVAGALLGAGGLFSYFATKLTDRTTRDTNLMDQQQEDIADLRKQIARIQQREAVRDDYIMVLRQHIADEKPPPPPPFPPALTGGHE